MPKYFHSDTHSERLTSSIFFCISFSWLSHSLLSTSNLSSSSAFSLDQSLSLCSRRQRRSMAAVCVSARSLRCSSLSRRSDEVSPCCSRTLRDNTETGAAAADWTPPLIKPAASLASNWRERNRQGVQRAQRRREKRTGRWEGKGWESQWRKHSVVIKDKLRLEKKHDKMSKAVVRNCEKWN